MNPTLSWIAQRWSASLLLAFFLLVLSCVVWCGVDLPEAERMWVISGCEWFPCRGLGAMASDGLGMEPLHLCGWAMCFSSSIPWACHRYLYAKRRAVLHRRGRGDAPTFERSWNWAGGFRLPSILFLFFCFNRLIAEVFWTYLISWVAWRPDQIRFVTPLRYSALAYLSGLLSCMWAMGLIITLLYYFSELIMRGAS
jgi:hypothetical protein